MQVVLFTDADVFAGTECHMLDLALSLRNCGVEVRIACPCMSPLARKAEEAGLGVLAIAKRGLIDWTAIRTLRGGLRSGQIDIIHAHNGRTALSAALAVTLAGAGQCVMTQHFLSPGHTTRRGLQARISNFAHGWVNGRIGHFIAISQAVKKQMLERADAADADVTVVHNGIGLPDTKTLADAGEIRRELGVQAHNPLIVCAARLEPEKDVATLVDAMVDVAAAHPGSVCAIAGDGSQRQELEERARRESPAVRFLGFRQDVLSVINAADLFVLPSLAEPFGLVLLEAMALGKPVVATGVGGPREIVVQGKTGLLVTPGRPQELAEAINRLLADPQARRAMGEQGHQRFLCEFTAARMAEQTARVYENLLQSFHLHEPRPDPRGSAAIL
jgi:glycosyltransferase involved in cell wall biosynthesis